MAHKLQFHGTYGKNAVVALSLLFSMFATSCARPEIRHCDSEDCKVLTESIAKSRDGSVRPCDNFYEHACGLWTHSHTIPTDAINWGGRNIIMQKVSHQLDDLLESVKYESTNSLEGKAKIAYDACKDVDTIEKNGVQFMLAVIEDLGGWPMTIPRKERIKTRDSWSKVHVIYGGMLGKGALINVNVLQDRFKGGKPTLYLDQPTELFKGLNIMNTEEDTNDYKFFVKTVVEAFSMQRNGKMPDCSILKKDIKALLKFRARLQEIMKSGLARRDVNRMYNPTTIAGLQNWNANINKKTKSVTVDWKSFIETTIEFSRNIYITDEEDIIVHETDYMKDLLILLAETDEEVIVNHIHLFFVENYLKYTDTKMKVLVAAVHRSEDTDDEDRWKTCLATHPMKHVLSLMFVKKHFPDTAREEISELVTHLQRTAAELIQNSPWLSPGVKTRAVRKLQHMSVKVGYPNWYKDPKIMADYYEGQKVSDVHLFNVLSYERMEYRREIEKLSPKNFRDDTDVYPIDLDIGYEATTNLLDIPAALMQLPMFGQHLPNAFLYGTIGHILSHEISHAFDKIGMTRNERGRTENWWDEDTLREYKKRIQCIIDKYSSTPIKELQRTDPDLRSNGVNTIDEDFADILGLRIAYQSYKKAHHDSKENDSPLNIKALRGIPEKQMFFYAFAQLYCEYMSEDAVRYELEGNEHSLNRLRVNVPLSNMAEFSEAFGCRADSFMNPRDKCYIW